MTAELEQLEKQPGTGRADPAPFAGGVPELKRSTPGEGTRPPLDVFITIDTEVWPLRNDWRTAGLGADIDRDVYGATDRGRFGLTYQLEVLADHKLKAVFFVEPLFTAVAGAAPLRRIVQEVLGHGQEVQLHLHPEWLAWMQQSLLPDGRTADNLKDLPEDEQYKLIRHAARLLREAGAPEPVAFRAGTYGANFDTLRALARNGIAYDTSHNACYLGRECEMPTPAPLLQPAAMHGVYEFPVSCFSDRPGHLRPAQLCACSLAELTGVMESAWKGQWRWFVIVSHSFEMLRRRRHSVARPLADGIVLRRFEKLCEFLAANRDRFRTSFFSEVRRDLLGPQAEAAAASRPLESPLYRTAGRLLQQAVRRIF